MGHYPHEGHRILFLQLKNYPVGVFVLWIHPSTKYLPLRGDLKMGNFISPPPPNPPTAPSRGPPFLGKIIAGLLALPFLNRG